MTANNKSPVLLTETRENDGKRWRHSRSTTPTPTPALWLAATSCDLAEKNEHFYFWLQSHRSHNNCEHEIARRWSTPHGCRNRSHITVITVNNTPVLSYDVLFCSFARHKAALSACPGAAISNARRQLLSQRRAHVRLSVQFLPRLSQPLTEVSQLMAVIAYAITLPASISIQIAHCDYH